MKKILGLIVLSLAISNFSIAQEKKKSPAKTVEAKLGEADVIISYSSPSMRGRVIYGDLVPYKKIWRAGANEATTMEFSSDVKINGKELKAGKYAFFVIPQKDAEWTIIFNTVHKQWGAYDYDATKDALKLNVKPTDIETSESLTYSIDEEGNVHLDWATTRISFKVD